MVGALILKLEQTAAAHHWHMFTQTVKVHAWHQLWPSLWPLWGRGLLLTPVDAGLLHAFLPVSIEERKKDHEQLERFARRSRAAATCHDHRASSHPWSRAHACSAGAKPVGGQATSCPPARWRAIAKP